MPARHRAKHRMQTKQAHRPRRRTTGARQSHDLKEALGASRSFPIVSKPHGPFGVMALLDELKGRLVSRGGRPADSAPTIRRSTQETCVEEIAGAGERALQPGPTREPRAIGSHPP